MKFSDLNLNSSLLNSLSDSGFEDCTSIQEQSFAIIMSGKDTIGIAQTGTGKTIAYLLPILRMWKYSKDRFPQILIMVPTRELVTQVLAEVNKMTRYMNFEAQGVYGGANINVQSENILKKTDLVVGTPGRLIDLILNGSLKTKRIKKLIIDEMDEMLNLGFRHQIISILDLLPQKMQHLLFSATLEPEVEEFSKEFFYKSQIVEAAPPGTPLKEIEQLGYALPNFYTKVNFLQHLLATDPSMSKVLVFVSSKKLADLVFERLDPALQEGIDVMHSNRSQNKRFEIVRLFKEGEIKAIIATDIIARGLDIESVTHVINFDLHEQAENYLHRIGRTGRAGKTGIAISFITEKDQPYKENIEALMNMKIPMKKLPAEIEISSEIAPHEIEIVDMPIIEIKKVINPDAGPAFHEKKDKNKKVNIRMSRADKMKKKYKKPQKRAQKRKGRIR